MKWKYETGPKKGSDSGKYGSARGGKYRLADAQRPRLDMNQLFHRVVVEIYIEARHVVKLEIVPYWKKFKMLIDFISLSPGARTHDR